MLKTNERGRKVLGIVKNEETLQNTINDLQIAGFDRAALGVVECNTNLKDEHPNIKPLKNKLGINIAPEEVGIGEGLILSLSVVIGVTIALLTSSSAVSDEAVILSFIYGAAFLALGVILIRFIDNMRLKHLKTQAKNGGVIICVKVRDLNKQKLAIEILKKHNAKDVKRIFAAL